MKGTTVWESINNHAFLQLTASCFVLIRITTRIISLLKVLSKSKMMAVDLQVISAITASIQVMMNRCVLRILKAIVNKLQWYHRSFHLVRQVLHCRAYKIQVHTKILIWNLRMITYLLMRDPITSQINQRQECRSTVRSNSHCIKCALPRKYKLLKSLVDLQES
jgi:hypothetical protein